MVKEKSEFEPMSNSLARREGLRTQLVEGAPFICVKRILHRGRVRPVAEMLVGPQPQFRPRANDRFVAVPAKLRHTRGRGIAGDLERLKY